MSNIAPEHGPRDFGAVGDGGPLPIGFGTRPAKPNDPIGTVTDTPGQFGLATYTDPGDSDNDMDEDGAASDIDC